MFGAPHYRDRVFVVAYPKCKSINITMEFRKTIALQQWREKIWCQDWEQFVLDVEHVAPSKWWTCRQPDPKPLLVRNDDGIPFRVDRLRALGNAIVPQIAYQIMMAIKEADK
jgi:DNA (cytosine-5)-methyltransferase 1